MAQRSLPSTPETCAPRKRARFHAALVAALTLVSVPALSGELIVRANSAYSTTLPWSPTAIDMFDLGMPADSFPIGGARPTLTSPNSTLSIGTAFESRAWASASIGVLKSRAITDSNPVNIGATPDFSGVITYSSAFFGDSLTWTGGGARNMRLLLSFSVPHELLMPKVSRTEILTAADDGDPRTPTPFRGYIEDYSAGLFLNTESSFVDRDLVNNAGLAQEFAHVKATCGACTSSNYNDFPDGRMSFYVPFVEGLPFSYGVSMTAYAGVFRETFGQLMSIAPSLVIPGSVSASLADRSLYFTGAEIVDEFGTVYGLDGLTSSLGMDYTHSAPVPEPSSAAFLLCGLALFGLRRTRHTLKQVTNGCHSVRSLHS